MKGCFFRIYSSPQLGLHFSVFSWCAVHIPSKGPIKIADVVVPAVERDLPDRKRLLDQPGAGDPDSVEVQIFDRRHPDFRTEETAELSFTQMHTVGKLLQRQILSIVFMDKGKRFFDEQCLPAGFFFVRTGRTGRKGKKMPDPQQPGFYQQLIFLFLSFKRTDLVKRVPDFFPDRVGWADDLPKNKFPGLMAGEKLLLDVVAPTAGKKILPKNKRRKGKGRIRLGLGGEKGMDDPAVDKKDVTGADFDPAVSEKSGTFPAGDHQKLVFLMPVRRDRRGPAGVRKNFVQLEVETKAAVRAGLVHLCIIGAPPEQIFFGMCG